MTNKTLENRRKIERQPLKELQPLATGVGNQPHIIDYNANDNDYIDVDDDHDDDDDVIYVNTSITIAHKNEEIQQSEVANKCLPAKPKPKQQQKQTLQKKLLLFNKVHDTRCNPTKNVNYNCCRQTLRKPHKTSTLISTKTKRKTKAKTTTTTTNSYRRIQTANGFPKLPINCNNIIARMLHGPSERILKTKFPLELQVGELTNLFTGGDVSPNIMDFYMLHLLRLQIDKDNGQSLKNILIMPAEFAAQLMLYKYRGAAPFTAGIDIFAQDLVIIPARLDNEKRKRWLLSAVNMHTRYIHCFDCTEQNDDEIFCEDLREYLRIEGARKHHKPFQFQLRNVLDHHQLKDSGVFCCTVAFHLVTAKNWEFKPKQFHYFRKKLLFDIVKEVIED